MIEDFFNNIESVIRKKMSQRFGLSETETKQSTEVIIEQLMEMAFDTFSKGNFQALFTSLSTNIDTNPFFQKLNATIVPELINKVGLSMEMAQKIKDVSLNEFFNELQLAFAKDGEKFDIMGKISKMNFNGKNGAQNLINTLSKFLKK